MNSEKNVFRLQHIIDCIEKIEIITKDLSYGSYLEDWIKQDAIIRNIEIIGEASQHVEDELKEKYPEVSWILIKGMRNFLVHEYFKVDHDAVWNTFQIDLPQLKLQIISIIKDIK
jgi:uncharacterized protein with HEPN domain